MKKTVFVCVIVCIFAFVMGFSYPTFAANVIDGTVPPPQNYDLEYYRPEGYIYTCIVASESDHSEDYYQYYIMYSENPIYLEQDTSPEPKIRFVNDLGITFVVNHRETHDGTVEETFSDSYGPGLRMYLWGKLEDGTWENDVYLGGTITHDASHQRVVWANYDVYFMDGVIYSPVSNLPGSLQIVMPIDGYKDNSWLYSIWTHFECEKGIEVDKLKVHVYVNDEKPENQELYVNLENNTVYEQNNKFNNDIRFNIELPVGKNIVKVVYEYDDNIVDEKTVNIERVAGYIDEDGDGKDDRTGRPDASKKPIFEDTEDMPQKPEDGEVLAWVQYIGEMIGYIFNVIIDAIADFAASVVEGISTVLGMARPMFEFVRQFFESLPEPMAKGIIALFSVGAAVSIFGLIRR